MAKQEKSAGAIIYYKDEEIKFLLVKYPRYWGFVKGLIEENENPEETALRETEEETRIKNVEILQGFKEKQEWFFKLKGQLIKKQAIFFLAKTTKEQAGKVKISWEHEDFTWLGYDDALEKIKIKANKEMLKKANEFILAFEKQKKLS